MRKLCIVISFCLLVFLSSGYSESTGLNSNLETSRVHNNPAYFTIYYDNQKIVVNDSYLKPAWFNLESKKKYKPIYQREAKNLQQNFPEFFHIVQKVRREVNIDAFDGTIHFDPERAEKFWITGASEGRRLDVKSLENQILAAVASKKHTDIIAPIIVTKPKSPETILSSIGRRARYSTGFDTTNRTRSDNIGLSASCFNGLTVAPGGQISFNKTVGPRTSARGYQEANIIIDGKFVKGVGGGVCQTSTTLFNAALLAGLTIRESHNHSISIHYVPPGRDAMVSSAVDLVLENNTGAPIYIEAGTKDNKVFFKIYGATMSGIEYKPKTEITEKQIEEQVHGNKPADTFNYNRIVMEHGKPDRTVLTYTEAYKDGKLLQRKLVRKSRYQGKPEIVRYEKVSAPNTGHGNPPAFSIDLA